MGKLKKQGNFWLPRKNWKERAPEFMTLADCVIPRNYFGQLQALGFQIPWITIFLFRAQRSWETIGNNFLVLWKFMGTHFYFF